MMINNTLHVCFLRSNIIMNYLNFANLMHFLWLHKQIVNNHINENNTFKTKLHYGIVRDLCNKRSHKKIDFLRQLTA